MGDLTVLQRVDQSTGSGSVIEWGPASSGVVRSAPVHTITGTTGLGDTSVLLSQVLCLGAVQFLHFSLQPARPTLYATSAYYRPFRAHVTFPTGERHTVELFACLWCLCLCAFIFC